MRTLTLRWKRSLVEKFKSPGEILDFGCGTGEFLGVMKKNQWTVNGVEPSGNARTRAEAHCGQKIYSSLSELPQTSLDIITLWHVLEHVSDLNSTLIQLKALLKKDGIIFIAVPNYESPDADHYKNYWAGYDVPRHLWHFSQESMNRLIARNGFQLIGTRPMLLDSFYVSILSEKYRNGSILKSFWNAFVSGLRSNNRARQGKNHSSLIYIVSLS
jgi:SAM-dependent methyltransferase